MSNDQECQKQLDDYVRNPDLHTFRWWTGCADEHECPHLKEAQEKYDHDLDQYKADWDEWEALHDEWFESGKSGPMPEEPEEPEEPDEYEFKENCEECNDRWGEPGEPNVLGPPTYIVNYDGTLMGVELQTCWGGPGVWLDTRDKRIYGAWWGLKSEAYINAELCDRITDFYEEMFRSDAASWFDNPRY